MSLQSNEHRVFKSFLRSIGSDELNSYDYECAIADLQNPEMMGLLEAVLLALTRNTAQTKSAQHRNTDNKNLVKKDKKAGSKKSPDQIFDDIKRRKITRDRLEIILKSLDSEFANDVDMDDTMRNIVNRYASRASDRQWEIFSSIVNGNYGIDPYLSNM